MSHRQAHFPVYGSSRKPSASAVVGTTDLPLTLPAKPQPPDQTGKKKHVQEPQPQAASYLP
ncbi:hypothetical protein [Sporosarcina ureae]|uniref:hypothetical protein n=1 Tax=Sporosarcina ureae TaxID=1571 RepID=UPI001B7FA2C4|nr:hypothetical protein [Sporosarcina ureae]